MRYDITLRNYRCFSDEYEARFTIGDGFTSLVGVNNSGKSSLLRFFYELRRALQQASGDLNSWLTGGASYVGWYPQGVADPTEIFSFQNERDLVASFEFDANDGPFPEPHRLRLQLTLNRAFSLNLQLLVDGKLFDKDWPGDPPNHDVLKTQLRPLGESLYIGPLRNAISVSSENPYFDIPVGSQFIQEWANWKTGPTKSRNEEIHRLEVELARIFGFSSLEINQVTGGGSFQVFADGRPFRLSELGSGLAQFIVVLGSAVMRRPAFILIDEPEMNLHPALQLDFLTTLGSYATDGVVFATHHLGLARSAIERVYALARVDGHTRVNKYEELTSLAEFLGALTFSGHSELGFSKVLLVEGTSEIKTIQQFLRMYGKEHEVVLLSLGGAGLIKPGVQHELAEIVRITPNAAALIDSERAFEAEPLESAREGFASDCAAVGIRRHVLERRSLENYFTEQAINSLYGSGAAALGPYDPTPPGWKKADNWRIARSMSQADIANTDLGNFLASL